MKKLFPFFTVLVFLNFTLIGCNQASGIQISQNSSNTSEAKDKCSYLTIAEANEILGFDLEKSKAPTADLQTTPCHYYDKKDAAQEKPAFYGVQFHVVAPAIDVEKYYKGIVASNKEIYKDRTIKDMNNIGKAASYFYYKSPKITVGGYPNSSHLTLWTYNKNNIISIDITSRESDSEENLLAKTQKIAEKILNRI